MATRKTNEAVEAYRKLARTSLKEKMLAREVSQLVDGLSSEELREYVEMTTAIDAAEAEVEAVIGILADSTVKQLMSRELTKAGLDT